jgi:hypothetical protein
MLDELTYQQRKRLRDQLAEIVCSSAWLDAIAPADENGMVRRFNEGVFPPGGDATIMCVCAECKRTCPPNAHSAICSDCEIESDEFVLLDKLSRAPEHRYFACIPSEREQLWRRRWRVPLRFAVTPTAEATEAEPSSLVNNPFSLVGGEEPYAKLGKEGESAVECPSYDEHSGNAPRGSDRLPHSQPANRHLAGEIACRCLGAPSPLIQFFDPIPRSSLASLPGEAAAEIGHLAEVFDRQLARSVRAATTSFRKVCRSLGDFSIRRRFGNLTLMHGGRSYCLLRYAPATPTRNVSIGSGRSAGCAMQLLPEIESGLQREIDYARKHRDAPPSAKRFTRRNPFVPAPEDFLGLQAFYRFRMTPEEREEWKAERRRERRRKAKRKARIAAKNAAKKAAKDAARNRKRVASRRADLVAIG